MRAGESSLVTRGVTAPLELISIRMLSVPCTTFTRWSWLCWPLAGAGLAAGAGFDAGTAATALLPGMTAGLTAGAGAPGAGLAADPAGFGAALLSLACFCYSDLAVLRALSMASGFCATALAEKAAPAVIVIAIARMPVVSFIAIPSSPPAFRALPRCWPLKVACRD